MQSNNIIRSILTILMMAVFAFSVTPKILLHNLVANHKDTPIKSNFSDKEQFDKAGFNCNCDNLVVESPFINDCLPIQIIVGKKIISQQSFLKDNFYFAPYFYFELRGPPSC